MGECGGQTAEHCPDWGYPCKHAAAVLYTLADRLDRDPFLLLAWLGRDRETLLESVRADAEGGGDDVGDGEQVSGSGLNVRARPLAECVDDFYAAADPARLPVPSRSLDPVSHADTDIPGLVAALTPMYELLEAGGPGASERGDA
ncbi:hypothetical protein EKD16_01260 [Streptomonospora litoralis]|uniref:SWIM-type domain-containing protein n=1 Tax=Streptomonospora litoralis TaxID=2498135 RepID=A0A4P6PZV4_9ACTN|nr:hypothetical protein EKD16_01260 [Streptomonospora litoralis]